MKPKIKLLATTITLSLFRLLRGVKRGLQAICLGLATLLAPLGRFSLQLFVLPLYRFGVLLKIRFNRAALPARGAFFFFITNRYLLHTTLSLLLIVVVGTNLRGRQAHAQDVGQRSILFALSSEDQEVVVEEILRDRAQPKPTSYLSETTISAAPHVDFDYDEDMDPVRPSRIIPGTIVAVPYDLPEEKEVAPRAKVETYVVRENDTISSIAQRFGVNVGTILWNNHLTEREYIRPGDKLLIPPVSGILTKVKAGDTLSRIAKRTNVSVEDIATANNLSLDAPLALGTELVIPGARPPDAERPRQVATRPEPPPVRLPFRRKPADADAGQLPAERLLWPTHGRVITQYYGWRHTGLDVDGTYDSPIYASANGIVEKAAWNAGGYGFMVLIDHLNGIKTRYAHASRLFVKPGDEVARGQVVAMIGSTGRSTGTHLHFEIYVNGRRTNPLRYIR